MGLLDFPCEVEGQIILLCWKLGEKSITHWHGLQEGFAGRKPIDERIAKAQEGELGLRRCQCCKLAQLWPFFEVRRFARFYRSPLPIPAKPPHSKRFPATKHPWNLRVYRRGT